MIAGKDPDFLRLLKHVKPDCDKPAFVIVSIRFLLLIKRGAERGGERGYRSLDVAGESVIRYLSFEKNNIWQVAIFAIWIFYTIKYGVERREFLVVRK